MRTKNCNHMRYGSWYTEWDGQNFLSFWAIFCPFTPLTNHKIKILKNERSIFRSYHFTRVYQKLRSYLWFFCHFGSFCLWPTKQPEKSKSWKSKNKTRRYYHFTVVYHKWQSCDVWFLKYGARETEFFIILDYFLPFYPSKKEQKTNKQTNTLGDIIILHMCTINENHDLWFLG